MRPDDRDLDEEIRSHLALSAKDRTDRGETPEAARLAALREFGYVPAVRDSMRRVWYTGGRDWIDGLGRDIRIAWRSLRRAPGLAATVIITLALGIGANAAIVSVARSVLVRPLVNRGEDRLLYIRQTAPGVGAGNIRFSVPEVRDLGARVSAIEAFGDFSTVTFTLIGAGEPRVVRAGVVNGSFFEVMGLRPILGRLLQGSDDGPDAASVVVLTHRFWTSAFGSDPSVIGRTLRLGPRNATVVGVLEPSVPYPADTEIIANVVTSPHHLEATMTTSRTHRMTELFGRLREGASLDAARAELTAAHAAMMRAHPAAYAVSAQVQLRVTALREQLTAPARPLLLLLLAAAGVVFVIACSNAASLVLARSVRREGELAVRAALGAGPGALRRTLLAESLVLCGAGAVLGVALAFPLVAVFAHLVARLSARALEVSVDASLLWVGAGLAMAAAVLLAYVPHLPTGAGTSAPGPPRHSMAPRRISRLRAGGNIRVTAGTGRRLRQFATAQMACSFVLLAAAGTLLATLAARRTADTGYDMRQVLAIDLPNATTGVNDARESAHHDEMARRIAALPGVEGAALGSFVPWRDAGSLTEFQFTGDGDTALRGEENPHGRLRIVAPGFFGVVGVPMLAGREFNAEDVRGSEPVVIVSQSVAQRLFPGGAALGRALWWTDPLFGAPTPRRIVGIAGNVDDEHVVGEPAMTIYHPLRQIGMAGRLFVRTSGDPYSLVEPVARVVREVSATQPVERAATLEDVRAAVLQPDRLNAFVLSGFACMALLIAAVGVAGVLAFSVSARTREFGVRLAVGSTPRQLLVSVLTEGALIAGVGIAAGAVCGFVLGSLAARYVDTVRLPGALPAMAAAAVLAGSALVASLMPAARAARVDVSQALRSE